MKIILALFVFCFILVGTSFSQNVDVKIDKEKLVRSTFGGIGFHSFHHSHTIDKKMWNEVVYKRWRELSPSFVRLNHSPGWSKDELDGVVQHLKEYKKTNTEVYFATWDPDDIASKAEADAYASKITDGLEYMVKTNQMDNVKYYCMSNELSLKGWGLLRNDMDKFRLYHQSFYNEFAKRNLPIKLLASDASPIVFWNTIEWCANNMDDITGVYGGHHYINDHQLTDLSFYNWFYEKVKWGVDIAGSKGKDFIIGEFGAKQNNILKLSNGNFIDRCQYYDTPEESMSAIQISTAILAAMNAGVYAMGYWTFIDFPNANPAGGYENKWGLTRWDGNDFSARDPYYAVGLLTKFFRGNGTVNLTTVSDSLVHATAVHHTDGTWSVAVINEKNTNIEITLHLPENIELRRYEYDPAQVPQNKFGDLQPPTGNIKVKRGQFKDVIRSKNLVVYTSGFDNQSPKVVTNIQVSRSDSQSMITWNSSPETDFCYYRVYRSERENFQPSITNQVASTISTSFIDLSCEKANPQYYKVIAVDNSGNASDK